MSTSLSENDILARLYSPSSSMPQLAGEKALVVMARGVELSVTHKEFEVLTQRALTLLKSQNISAGDNVVFCCENHLEYLPTLLACWSLKAMTTLIDYRAEPAEVVAVCERLDAKLLLISAPVADFKSIEAQKSFSIVKIEDVNHAKICDEPIDFQSLEMEKPLLALFTSGTTGAPKTAIHSLRDMMQNIGDLVSTVNLPDGLTGVTPLPVSHVFGLTVLLVTQVLGMKSVLTTLDPVTFIKAVHWHKPHLIAALPQFYGALLSAPKGVVDLKNVRLLLSGGAPLTVSLSNKFKETFGQRLNNGYGSTESKVFALNQDGPVLSVGKAIPGVQLKVIDAQGNVLPDGTSGEIIVLSNTLMKGYLNDDAKTKKVLNGNRYYTGDWGRLIDGYLYVAGRKDDIVTVAGVVVHSAEIEEALRNYDQVKDVAVTAVSNKRLGQIIKASIVLMNEEQAKGLESMDADEQRQTKLQLVRQFKAYCKEHLSRYKRPMKFEFLGPHDDLPKTLAGKIDKKALREQQH